MKIIYYSYIEYVIGQAVDAVFAQDLYNAYKIRFSEVKESIIKKDVELFFSD